jgi:hypothetical protein
MIKKTRVTGAEQNKSLKKFLKAFFHHNEY